MSKLSVYMINIDFYPLLGGAQMHTLRLSHCLREHGVDVAVITRHHEGLAFEESIDGVPVYRTPIFHSAKATASLSFTFHALKWIAARRDQAAIVHSHEMLSPMTIGLFSRALFGTRLVVNPHRGGYLGDIYKLKNRRRGTGKLRLAWASKAASAFVAVSKEITQELVQGGIPQEKIHFIPYALDTRHFRPPSGDERAEIRSRLGLGDRLTAIYTGRLVPEKGLDLLLEAWAGVAQVNPQALLVIAGDGEQRSALEAQARQHGLEQQVRFIGQVADTAPYLQAADLYVQPSFTEGLPIAMLEAMACGLPVLATAVGGVPDLIRSGENGLLAPPRNIEGLRQNLVQLAQSPDLRGRLGARARESVEACCAIEKITQDHIRMYHQILNPAAAQYQQPGVVKA